MTDIFDDTQEEDELPDRRRRSAPAIGGLEDELRAMLEADGFGDGFDEILDIADAVQDAQEPLLGDAQQDEDSDGGAAEPPPTPARVVEDPSETCDDMAERLGLALARGWVYLQRDTGRPCGYLRALPNGRSIKVVCRLHPPSCSHFLNLTETEDFGSTCKRLVRWLHGGLAEGCDAAAHIRMQANF